MAPRMNYERMKIYSWNMLFHNAEPDRAFEFIAKSDFDIFCLQEVPQAFLDRLLALPCYHAYTIDVERLHGSEFVPIYLVILSKYPISNETLISFPDYWPNLLVRTSIFVHLMRPFHFTRIRNRSGLSVDIALPSGITHLFNLHLILAHPELRLREFEKMMSNRNASRAAIICGDFNILEARSITILNWLLGGTLHDVLFHKRERTLIEKRFVAYELRNPLRGSVTHPLSRSQLDHILVSHSFSIKFASVLPDRVGSDHHPIFVETA